VNRRDYLKREKKKGTRRYSEETLKVVLRGKRGGY